MLMHNPFNWILKQHNVQCKKTLPTWCPFTFWQFQPVLYLLGCGSIICLSQRLSLYIFSFASMGRACPRSTPAWLCGDDASNRKTKSREDLNSRKHKRGGWRNRAFPAISWGHWQNTPNLTPRNQVNTPKRSKQWSAKVKKKVKPKESLYPSKCAHISVP